MATIDQVELKVEPYDNVIIRAVDEMLKVYSYAPSDYDLFSRGEKSINDESAILLKQAALLETGQSTEVRVIQSKTANITDTKAKYTADDYLQEVTNSETVFVNGDTVEYKFKAQAIRNTDGCTIHVSFNAKYDGNGRMICQKLSSSLCREDEVDENLHLFMYGPFETLREQIGITEKDGNAIEFVKKLRGNDLIPGINLSSLSDEEIEDALEYESRNVPATIVYLLMEHSGLSVYDFLEKYLSVDKSTARFDLSQLSFHFEYDIEIDEETFLSYFEIDSDEDHDSKLDKSKTNADAAKPRALKNLEDLMNRYKARLDEEYLKDLFDEEDCSKATSISFDGSTIEVDLESGVSEIIYVESEDNETGRETEYDVEVGADFSYSVDYTIGEDFDEYLEDFQNALNEAIESGQSTFKIEVPFEASEAYNIEVGEIEIYDDEVDEEEVYAEAVRSIERGLANTSFEMHHGDHIQPPQNKMVRFICTIPTE